MSFYTINRLLRNYPLLQSSMALKLNSQMRRLLQYEYTNYIIQNSHFWLNSICLCSALAVPNHLNLSFLPSLTFSFCHSQPCSPTNNLIYIHFLTSYSASLLSQEMRINCIARPWFHLTSQYILFFLLQVTESALALILKVSQLAIDAMFYQLKFAC